MPKWSNGEGMARLCSLWRFVGGWDVCVICICVNNMYEIGQTIGGDKRQCVTSCKLPIANHIY